MNENQIADIWMLFKEYVDKKAVESLAERYIDLLADHGISDKVLQSSIGYDDDLDEAIEYYLDQDSEESYEDEDNWDYNEDEE
ncbi:MAG: hypothetical protein EB127_30125 [Alphaproteobacteria bacterium]|nr:hypothetical protein [Alphaproteobacteria bacterium]